MDTKLSTEVTIAQLHPFCEKHFAIHRCIRSEEKSNKGMSPAAAADLEPVCKPIERLQKTARPVPTRTASFGQQRKRTKLEGSPVGEKCCNSQRATFQAGKVVILFHVLLCDACCRHTIMQCMRSFSTSRLLGKVMMSMTCLPLRAHSRKACGT